LNCLTSFYRLENPGLHKRGVKRARSEDVFASLQEIKKQQETQMEILKKILNNQPIGAINPVMATALQPDMPRLKRVKKESEETSHFVQSMPLEDDLPALERTSNIPFGLVVGGYGMGKSSEQLSFSARSDFDSAFHNFLYAWQSTPPEERPRKLRRLVMNEGVRDVRDIVETMATSIEAKTSEQVCLCTRCPYKRQVAEFDGAVATFLQTGAEDYSTL